jgi:hypothetical protein
MDSAKPADPNFDHGIGSHSAENKLEVPTDPKSIEFNTINTIIACFCSIAIYCVSLFIFNSISSTGSGSVPDPQMPQLQVEDIVEVGFFFF